MDKEKANKILKILKGYYGGVGCELNYSTPFELLVAVILSAQCTDKRVNEVTKGLFKVYRKPEQFAAMEKAELVKFIHSCGFYNNKSDSILAAARQVCDNFGGIVPADMDKLLTIRGVGRKTANVILAEAYKIPAFPVDTHVLRLSNRIGFSDGLTPDEVETEVTALLDPSQYIETHHLLIHHGRTICKAIRPDCDRCPIQSECEYF